MKLRSYVSYVIADVAFSWLTYVRAKLRQIKGQWAKKRFHEQDSSKRLSRVKNGSYVAQDAQKNIVEGYAMKIVWWVHGCTRRTSFRSTEATKWVMRKEGDAICMV